VQTYKLVVPEERLAKVMSVVMGCGVNWRDVKPDDSSPRETTIMLNEGFNASMREAIRALRKHGFSLQGA